MSEDATAASLPAELAVALRRGTEARHRGEYERRITDMGEAGWYWHLYLDGQRLNGGLSATREEAVIAAGCAVTFDRAGHYCPSSCGPSRLETALL